MMDVEEFRSKVFKKELSRIMDFDDELSGFLENCDEEYYEAEEDLNELLGQYLESIN